MFYLGQVAKILYCPEFPQLNMSECTLIKHLGYGPSDSTFVPSDYERKNSYYEVKPRSEATSVNAYVRHKVNIGNLVIVDGPPIGWGELKGRKFPVEQINSRRCVIRTTRGLTVEIEDYHPVDMRISNEESSEVFSKQEIADAILGLENYDMLPGTDLGALLTALNISLTNDVDVATRTKIRLEFDLKINYPKGITVGDKKTAYLALARELQGKTEEEMANFFYGQRVGEISV